jgi:hypothetical protein
MLLFTVFGCRGRPTIWGCPGSDYGDLTKTRRFGPFLPVFYAIIHSFLVVVVVRTFGEARGPVTGTSPKLADLVHSYLFSMLLLTDFGSRAIQTFREQRGPLMWNSPKFTDLVHSYQFSLLLFNVFWLSWSSERSATPGDRLRGPRQNSNILSVLASFLCYYSLILGLGVIQ